VKFTKMAMGLILGVFLVGATYFISSPSREKLQANVYVEEKSGNFPDLAKSCPDVVAHSDDADKADYTLKLAWLPNTGQSQRKGWLYDLERRDGALLTSLTEEYEHFVYGEPDATKVARRVCRDIQRDFPLWLNTQRVRASIGKPAQMGTTTSVEDDPPRRYEMMEYRNGQIIGQALLDTKLGRLWTLTNIVNSAGQTERTEFKEISVENLWESEDEAVDMIQSARSDDTIQLLGRANIKLSRVKELTRPAAIQRAEEQAEKEH
jgi:hypothetical protein